MDLLELVNDVRYDRDATDRIPASDLQTLWAWRQEAAGVKAAAGHVLTAIEGLIAVELDGGVARMDDFFVKVRPRRTLRVLDPDAFWDFLGSDARLAFNPNTVRLTSLKKIAEKRERDPQVIFDSLCAWDEREPGLDTVPLDKAPGYVKEMAHGEIRAPRSRRSA